MIRSVSFDEDLYYIVVSYTQHISSPKIYRILNTENDVRVVLKNFHIDQYDITQDTNYPSYLRLNNCYVWVLKVDDIDIANGLDISSSNRRIRYKLR